MKLICVTFIILLYSCNKVDNIPFDQCTAPTTNKKVGPVMMSINTESYPVKNPFYFPNNNNLFLYRKITDPPKGYVMCQYDFSSKITTPLFSSSYIFNDYCINKNGLIYLSTGFELFFMSLDNLFPQYDLSEKNRNPIFNQEGNKLFYEHTNDNISSPFYGESYIFCQDLVTNQVDTVRITDMAYGSISKEDNLYFSFISPASQNKLKYSIGRVKTSFPYDFELIREFDDYTPRSITCNKQDENLLYFTENVSGVIIELNIATKSLKNLTQKCSAYGYEEISCSPDGKNLLATKRYYKCLYDAEGRVSPYYQYDYSIVKFSLSTYTDEVVIP
ncbi:MAG: hypothetical protein HYU67_01545 [Flavobacteriia bacterium]|nr:hypothetical protein [Flavobacteriia bacterium]